MGRERAPGRRQAKRARRAEAAARARATPDAPPPLRLADLFPRGRPTAEAWLVGGFVLSMVAWFAGGFDALDSLLDGDGLTAVTLLGAAVSGLAAGLLGRAREREALARALLVGTTVALLLSSGLALGNEWLDTSAPDVFHGQIVGYRQPRKGPLRAALSFAGRRVDLRASRVEGMCPEGAAARISIRHGALGMPWISAVECPRPERPERP